MWKVPFYFNCDCDSVTDITFTHSFSTRPFSALRRGHEVKLIITENIPP